MQEGERKTTGNQFCFDKVSQRKGGWRREDGCITRFPLVQIIIDSKIALSKWSLILYSSDHGATHPI